jgi:hypothetical protein
MFGLLYNINCLFENAEIPNFAEKKEAAPAERLSL